MTKLPMPFGPAEHRLSLAAAMLMSLIVGRVFHRAAILAAIEIPPTAYPTNNAIKSSAGYLLPVFIRRYITHIFRVLRQLLHIIIFANLGMRVPHTAAWALNNITPINMNRIGFSIQRVGYGMNSLIT